MGRGHSEVALIKREEILVEGAETQRWCGDMKCFLFLIEFLNHQII